MNSIIRLKEGRYLRHCACDAGRRHKTVVPHHGRRPKRYNHLLRIQCLLYPAIYLATIDWASRRSILSVSIVD